MATVALTRVTRSATLRVESALLNTILELPEEAFWHLVDIRLNRPKGIRVSTNILGERYAQIIDLNDKPSIVERWTELFLVERLFLELATTKILVSHQANCGITIHKYYKQAQKLQKWIPITRPPPEFVVNLSDLSTRVVAELKTLEHPLDVLKQAVGRIFENIEPVQYHQCIASKLRVRLDD